jgi:hypothetical protein
MIVRPGVLIGLGLVLTLLPGCEAMNVDVSSDPMYARYIAQQCVTNQHLQAQGVAVNYERARGTDSVMVSQPLAVRSCTTFVRDVQAGTRFIVLSAQRCADCVIDEIVTLQVKFEDEPMDFAGKPVYLRPRPDMVRRRTQPLLAQMNRGYLVRNHRY